MKLIFFLMLAVTGIGYSQGTSRLDSLLVRCHAAFTLPEQLEIVERDYMRKIPHDLCLHEKTKGAYEVRLLFQPLDSMISWYKHSLEKDPEAELLEPNSLCKSMMTVAVLNASNNKKMNYEVVTSATIRKLYNADWMASALVEVPYESIGFKFCRIICIHKDDVGEIYIYYLTNKTKLLQQIDSAMSGAVKFN